MQITRVRNGVIAVVTSAVMSFGTAAVSIAAPINPTGGGSGSGAAGCKMPGNGKTIDSGSQGTDSDGTVYSCTNGVGCQVQGGKVTDKCSHMSTVRGKPPRVTAPVTVTPPAAMAK